MSDRIDAWRVWLIAGIAALALIVIAGYATVARRRSTTPHVSTSGAGEARALLPRAPDRPFVMFQSLITDDSWGRVGLAPLDDPGRGRYLTGLECDLVHFGGGFGICLTADEAGLVTTYRAITFDDRWRPLHTLTLTGTPSRARVSPDGHLASVTVFETGHSYAEGGFSTRTTLFAPSTGAVVGDLEQFAVWRDGARIQAADFNFWGVTFARDSNRFFATLSTGGVEYLVEGRAREREIRVVRPGVECPSISPDDTRIIYKNKIDRQGAWRLHLLELDSMADRAVDAETRSIDDQVEWLDDLHVLYHVTGSLGSDIWVLPIDGSGPPRILVPQGYSPVVVR